MNNLEKKLDALIDALGFDVETTLDYQERKISESEAMRINNRPCGVPSDYVVATNRGQMLDIDSEGMYTRLLHTPIIDYKLTKKNYINKPTIHKLVRKFERQDITASELIGQIMLMEGVTDEDL